MFFPKSFKWYHDVFLAKVMTRDQELLFGRKIFFMDSQGLLLKKFKKLLGKNIMEQFLMKISLMEIL